MGLALNDDGTAPCFEPVRRVAQSYLGVLWLAADKRDGEKGATALLRRVRLPKDAPPEVRDAITRAAAAARDHRHPNLVSVIDVLEDGAELGVAYEPIDGEPLRSLQSSAELRGRPFPVPVSLRIGIDLLMGLEALHQACSSSTTLALFGGLSPDSVLVSRKGEAKLLDALVASCASLLEAIGTHPDKLGYAAPEQVHPIAPLTAQSDLFAVGAVLWELLTGRRLLVGTRSEVERKLLEHDLPSLSDAAREEQPVSPVLVAMVDAALAADPGKRPASARALAVQLRDCGHPVASREELAQFVAELSAPPSERRAAAAQGKPLPSSKKTLLGTAPPANEPSPPAAPPSSQVAPEQLASVSSARSIRLPMPARARSRAERSPSPAPLQATLQPSTPAPPVLASPAVAAVTKAEAAVARPIAAPPAPVAAPRAPAAAPPASVVAPPASVAAPSTVRVATPAPDVPPAPSERRAPPPRQTPPQRAARLEQPAPAPKAPPPRAGARSAAQPLPSRPLPSRPLPSRPRMTAASAAPPPPLAAETAPPEAVASPEVAPPELQVSELEMSEVEASEVEASEVEASEVEASEVEALEHPLSEVEAPDGTPSGPLPARDVAPQPTMPPEGTLAPAVIGVASTSIPHEPAIEMDAAPLPAATADPVPADEPAPSSERHAFSLPPTPVVPRAAEAWRSSEGVQRAGPRWLRNKVSLGLMGAALGVGAALAVDSALRLPSADAGAVAELAAAPAPAAEPGASLPVAAAPAPAAEPGASLPVAAAPAAAAPLAAAPAAVEPLPALRADVAAPDSKPPPDEGRADSALGDFHSEQLGDGQLAAAFALEQRREVPACSERLGASSSYKGDQPQPSRAHFNAARRALQRGQLDTAYTSLCMATAHDLDNVDAQRSLAELALDLGDPARAKEAAELGLARAPKNVELLGVLGDALAILGEIPESRRLWLESVDEKTPEAERTQRLAASYQKAGERSLSTFNFARARSYFRRALILTEGGYEPSLGLGDALLWLDQGSAGLAWAERVASALPASARAQILLGDAHAKNGELDRARDAWRAARSAEPGNAIAARRLRRGPR